MRWCPGSAPRCPTLAAVSSSTSSRTSTSSSTSEEPPLRGRPNGTATPRRGWGRIRAARLVHPFPSVLDGIATTAIGVVAGGQLPTALRLGVAMTLLQFAIGATNDIVDAETDAGRADKPLVAGVVSPRRAIAVALGFGVAGLALTLPSGPVVVALAASGLGLGLAYDLRLKRTGLAWLPFALGIPLLVVFAWYGATGRIGGPILVVVPAAALAGASLSLANALVDPDADRAAGLVTPVVVLGAARARRLSAVLLVITLAVVVGSLVLLRVPAVWLLGSLPASVVAAIGLHLTADPARARRERAWELEAIGIALLGAVWVAGVVAVGW